MRNLLLLIFLFIISGLIYGQVSPDPVDPVMVLPLWLVSVIGLVVLIIEYILGKTTLIKPNSILDVVVQIILKVCKLFLPNKE